MHVLCFHIYTEYLYLLLEFCHCDNFNTAFGSCGYFNLPTVRSQRQPIFQDTLACTYSLVGLVQLLELGTKTGRVNAQLLGALHIEYWHSRVSEGRISPRTFCPSANCLPLVQNVPPYSLCWAERTRERCGKKKSV